MRTESQRAQPRVDYPAEVRITSPGLRQPITGRSLNLSPSGIFVEAEAPCDVGTSLVCDIPLPGGRRRLKGRVARTQALPRESVGLGIEFTDLDARDEAVLRQLVRGAGAGGESRLVKVRFEGLRDPLRSEAVLTDEGIRLSTALPFLRLSSEVDVSFIAGDSKIESKGTVREVQIEPASADGVPRLAVDVDLDPLSEAALPLPRRAPGVTPLEPQRSGGSAPIANRPASGPRRRLKARGLRNGGSGPHTAGATPEAPSASEASTPVIRMPGFGDVPPAERLPLPRPLTPPPARPEEPRPRAVATPTPGPGILWEEPQGWPEETPVGPLPAARPAGLPRETGSRPGPPIERSNDVPPTVSSSRNEPPARWRRVILPTAVGFLAGVVIVDHFTMRALERYMRAAPPPAGVAVPAPSAAPAEAPSRPAVELGPSFDQRLAQPRASAPAPEGAHPFVLFPWRPIPAGRGAPPAPVAAPPDPGSVSSRAPAGLSGRPAYLVSPAGEYRDNRALPPGTPGPEIVLDGDQSTAIVPVRGSTAGVIHYSLLHPSGIAVNLPHATSVLPPGVHWVWRDGFRAIWIRERLTGGLQIRFLFTDPPPDERVLDVDGDAVKIRLRLRQASSSPAAPAPSPSP